VTVRWAQRIERLVALASKRLEEYRQAAAWVAGRRLSADKEQGKVKKRQAWAGTGCIGEEPVPRPWSGQGDKAEL
jgi:hypothetical protein